MTKNRHNIVEMILVYISIWLTRMIVLSIDAMGFYNANYILPLSNLLGVLKTILTQEIDCFIV